MILLLRYLLIIISILWLIKVIARVLLPILFHSLVKKAQQPSNNQHRQQSSRKPEGSIRVDFVPPKDREARAADKAGEFIDYEEIK